jgi:HAD superfamily hydrolase (TIGR01509 family)
MSRGFQLIIFDCDGVLVDSERITNRVFAEMLGEIGIDVTLDEMFEQFMGRTLADCIGLITQKFGRAPPTDFLQRYRPRRNAALLAEAKAIPGIEYALDRITIPFCVASSGEHEKMRATLGATGLLRRFAGKIFSATEVARGKPAPDVFLLAANRLNTPPNECLVIEDTATGVTAGVAAGMTVFGYSALIRPERLLEAGARLTFDNMHELPALIHQAR